MFAEFNPAPVLRIDSGGSILQANPTARMLLNIDESTNNIRSFIPELQHLDLERLLSNNATHVQQIVIGDEHYQLDIKAISDFNVIHIYAAKNSKLVNESNQRRMYQVAFEKSSDSIMVTDLHGNIVFVNKAFEDHSGYTFNESKGKNPRFLNSGFQSKEIYKEMWKTIAQGETWKGLFRNKKKNGDLYWEKATIIPVNQPNGAISNYMAVKEDVTEELQQKETINSLALFAKHNPAPVLRFQKEGIIVEANPAAKALFKATTLTGTNIKNWICKLENVDIENIISNNIEQNFQCSINNKIFQMVIKGVNEINLCNIYGSDITAQKEAEKTIESMALFAKLNPEPVFRFDTNFIIIEANPAAIEAFPSMIKNSDIRNIMPSFSNILIPDFISNNQITHLEEKINNKVFRFLLRGLSKTNVCQVYSSDITQRVEQESKIKEQAEKIQGSINYASLIQMAVLPNPNIIHEFLPEHFLLYLPRDIVSGDFYWVKNFGDKTVIAIADCTGHGVPGAFMSMLGVAFLNEIVKPETLVANEILNKLRSNVINTLSNSIEKIADGMDIALCIIDHKKHLIEYAGANNPFIMITQEDLHEIKADKMPIGKYIRDERPFTLHELKYTPGDIVYLYSDGFQDQLEGPKISKFGSRKFKELLYSIHNQDFNAQKEVLKKTLEEWTSSFYRIDDVLVMGFKL